MLGHDSLFCHPSGMIQKNTIIIIYYFPEAPKVFSPNKF